MSISLPVSAFPPEKLYFLLRDSVIPRPVGWISSVDAHGRSNLAPFSFFNVMSANPPVLGFSCGARGEAHGATGEVELKDTLANVKATRQFVVNIAPEKWLNEMVRSSDPLSPGESEFAHIGLDPATSTTVQPPRVAGAPVAYECALHDILHFGNNAWVIGRVQHIHIDESVYRGELRVDLMAEVQNRPVGRLGRAFYARIRNEEVVERRDGGQAGT